MFRPQNPRYKEVHSATPRPSIPTHFLVLLPTRFLKPRINLPLTIGGKFRQIWQTASLYHLVHTAALLGAPITKRPNIVSVKPVRFVLSLLI